MRIASQKTTAAGVILQVLSNHNRYAALKILFASKKDLCVHELAEKIGISPSAMSHQLAYLEACGVVTSERMGKMTCYLPSNAPVTRKLEKVLKALQ